MTILLVYGYLSGWLVASLGAATVARRLRDPADPAPHPGLVSLVAGAAWPLLALAAAEAGVMAVVAEVLHKDEPVLVGDV